jgi:DNA-binding CsgD family transcriptional regulator
VRSPHGTRSAESDRTPGSFVGRTEELASLRTYAIEAAGGRPWVVVIEGPAGIGKTAFVRQVEGQLDGFTVIHALADSLATSVSMYVLSQLVEVRNPAPLTAGLELLNALAAYQVDGPVAVVIEDAHWADDASMQALATALWRLDAVRVLTLVTTRAAGSYDNERWTRLVADADRCRLMPLGPLTDLDVQDLAASREIQLTPAAATRLQRHTTGNALHVGALLREMTPDQLNLGADLPAPRSLAASTIARMAELPPPARELIRALAVTNAAPLVSLGAVAAVDDPTEALDIAMTTGFIEWTIAEPAHEVRFTHPLYQAAIYDDLPPMTRRALHLAAAALTDPTSALDHRVAAADRTDEALAADLERAATTADPTMATARLTAAADLSGSPDEAVRRLLRAGRICREVGRVDALRRLRPRLIACPPSSGRDLLLGWLAFEDGDAPEAERALREATQAPHARPDEVAAALVELAAIYNSQSRGVEALAAAEAADGLGVLSERDQQVAWMMAAGGVGQVEGAVRGLEAMAERFPTEVHLNRNSSPAVIYALALLNNHAGRPLEAIKWFAALSDDSMHDVLAGRLAQIHMVRAQAHFRAGQWDDALVHAHVAVDLATDLGQIWVLAQANGVASYVRSGRGQWDAARLRIGLARSAAAKVPTADALIVTAQARAILGHAAGRPNDVVGVLDLLVRRESEWAAWNLQCVPMYVAAILDCGRLQDGIAELARLAEAVERRSLDMKAQLSWLGAKVAALRDEKDAAVRGYEDAFGQLGANTDFLDRVGILTDYGRFLRAIGRRREGQMHLADARQLLAGVGATPYVERLDRDLLGPNHVAQRPGVDPASTLTERERDVVTLVIDGRTNRETAETLYMSVKSVEFHLGNVYAKLHISSRRQLKGALVVETGSGLPLGNDPE